MTKKKKSRPLIGKDGKVRGLTAADMPYVEFTPLRDSFPELAAYARERKKQRGRPKSAAPKKLQSFKLSPDVIDTIRNSGPGYNTRVESVLRHAIEDGLFRPQA
jgi:uncharacterized protein (DUF4415 family)